MNNTKSLSAYLLFAEAWIFLASARFMLLFFPFKKIVPILGKANYKSAEPKQFDAQIFPLVSLSLKRACKYSPWRTKCFEQALAAKMMLKRRRATCTIFFGAYRSIDDAKLKAHAWLESNGIVVTGGGNLDRYTVVGSFTS